MGDYAKPMTREQAVEFFTEFFCGSHHIPAKRYPGQHGVYGELGFYWVNYFDELATWDMDRLSRLVLLAHDRCVRVAVSARGRCLQISITNRLRDGQICSGHPTLEEAVARWRRLKQDGPLAPPAGVEVARG